MIRLSLGNVGSGKTLMEVREMALNPTGLKTYTNIATKGIKSAIAIKPEMIVKKTPIPKGKTGKQKYDLSLNLDYWKSIKEPINIVIDEAHILLNPRRSMSKVNIVMTDWVALIRRVLGQAESGEGNLVLITQLWNRLDTLIRDMATQVRYHVCHYSKRCKECSRVWHETSEWPEPLHACPWCHSRKVVKFGHIIEIRFFTAVDEFIEWKINGTMTFYKHQVVTDSEKYFKLYDTLQWDNLFSELY